MTLQSVTVDYVSGSSEGSGTGTLLSGSSFPPHMSVSSLAPAIGLVAQPLRALESTHTVWDRLIGQYSPLAAGSNESSVWSQVRTAISCVESISPDIYSLLGSTVGPSRLDVTASLYREWLEPLKSRLKNFATLPPNWDQEGAEPITAESIGTAVALISWFALSAVPAPDVFPTNEGGVLMEWHIYGLNAEIEIAPTTDPIEVFYQDLRTGVHWHKPLSAGSDELLQVHSRLVRENG